MKSVAKVQATAPSGDRGATGKGSQATQRPHRGNAEAAERLAATLRTPGVTGEKIALTPELMGMLGGGGELSGATAVTHGYDNYTDKSVAGASAFVQADGEHATGVSADDVAQGNLANCYFMAAMMAVARANPQAIADLIVKKDDGTYDVTLHAGWLGTSKVYNVTADFPKGAAGYLGASPGDEGKEIWPMLLEKAYAMHKGSYKATEWGDSAAAMELLTGMGSDNLLDGFLDNATKPAAMAKKIATWLNEGRAITAATLKWDAATETAAQEKYGRNFSKSHEYAVKAASESAASITLENPWEGQGDDVVITIDDARKYLRAIYLLDD